MEECEKPCCLVFASREQRAEDHRLSRPITGLRSMMSQAEVWEPNDEAAMLGEEVEVFSIREDGGHFLDEKQLERILLADDVKDKPVVVISVTGKQRQGKSFLMNFLLRYADKRSDEHWMGDPSAPLEGFTWRGGCDAVTKGIRFWRRVFLARTPKGREVAVVFMDTQGTFDVESSAKDRTTIIALTTILSSVQIHNLVKNINSDDLENLLLFTEYAELAKKDNCVQPFQKLLFLIRDWNSPKTAAYGYEGGRAFLNRRLNIIGKQRQKMGGLRDRTRSWFDEVDCFLMPHPGLTVDREESDGRLSEIHEDFLQNLNALVTSILDPANLLVKQINGRDITCRDLYSYMKAFSDMFEGDKLSPPTSWRQATATGDHEAAALKAVEIYQMGMKGMFAEDAPKRTVKLLEKEHERFRQEALKHFQSIRKVGGEVMSKGVEERIEEIIKRQYEECFGHVTREVNARKKARKQALAWSAATGIGVFSITAGVLHVIPPAMVYQMLELALKVKAVGP